MNMYRVKMALGRAPIGRSPCLTKVLYGDEYPLSRHRVRVALVGRGCRCTNAAIAGAFAPIGGTVVVTARWVPRECDARHPVSQCEFAIRCPTDGSGRRTERQGHAG